MASSTSIVEMPLATICSLACLLNKIVKVTPVSTVYTEYINLSFHYSILENENFIIIKNKPLTGIAPATFALPRQRNSYYATEA